MLTVNHLRLVTAQWDSSVIKVLYSADQFVVKIFVVVLDLYHQVEEALVSSLKLQLSFTSTTKSRVSYDAKPYIVSATSVRPPFSWNTVTPTQTRWVPYTTMPTRRAPWYIKDR